MAPNIFCSCQLPIKTATIQYPPHMILFLKINYIIIYTIVIYLYFSKIIQP